MTTLVLGDGFTGDGGLASKARVSSVWDVAVDAEGSILIADSWNHRIRKIGQDGTISTIIGNGTKATSGDGGIALQAGIPAPQGVAVGRDGSIYVSTHQSGQTDNYIRKVTVDGKIQTIAGIGLPGISGDGGLATQARLYGPQTLVERRNGDLCWTEILGNVVRCRNPQGRIFRVLGTGEEAKGVDGIDPLESALDYPEGIDEGPDGALYVLDRGNARVRVVRLGVGYDTAHTKVVAADGTLRVFHLDGRPHAILSPLTNDTLRLFRYDDSLQLRAVVERNGDSTKNEAGVTGMVVTGPERLGSKVTHFEKDADGNVVKATLPDGRSYSMSYGKGGLLTEFVKPNGVRNIFGYNADGELVADSVAAGGVQRIEESTLNGIRTVTRTDASGASQSYSSWVVGDTTVRTVTVDGVKSLSKSAENGYRFQSMPDGSSIEVIPHTDPQWGLSKPLYDEIKILADGTRLTVHRGAFVRLDDVNDPQSLAFRVDTTVSGGATYISEWTTATRTRVNKGPSGLPTTTRYDKLDRVLEVKVGDSVAQSVSYDDATGLETWVKQGVITKIWRNAEGQIDSVQGADGETLRYIRDADNQPQAIPQPGGGKVGLRWDEYGRLAGLTPYEKSEHRFLYNSWGGDSLYLPPVVNGKDGQVEYRYDTLGRLRTVAYSGTDSVVAGFDAKSRWSTLSLKDGSVSYGYTGDNPLFTSATRTLPGGGTQGLALQINGTRIDGETWSGEVTGSVQRSWTVNQTLGALTVNGTKVNYAWGIDGRLLYAGDASYLQDDMYSRLRQVNLDDLQQDLYYDQLGFGPMIGDTLRFKGQSLYAQRLGYDMSGRIDRKTEYVWDYSSTLTRIDSTRWQYGYTNGRLTTVLKNGVQVGSYAWDGNGNRLGSTVDAQDRLVTQGDAHWEYDAIGHLKRRTDSRGVWDFHYDALWNLLSAKGSQTIDYVVDARGRRVGRKVNGVLVQGFLYGDQLEPVAELDGSNQVVSRFVYGSRPHVPDYMIKDGVKYRLVTDHLGSVRFVVNTTTGETVSRIDYDAWGKVTNSVNLSFQPFGFAGGLRDDATGLVRFGARDYDPYVGRWTGKDIVGFNGGLSNVYSYVGGDPIGLIDPSGLAPDMNFFKKNDRIYKFSQLYANEPGEFSVAGHGDTHTEGERRGNLIGKDGVWVDVPVLAIEIKKKKAFKSAQFVTLLVCKAGEGVDSYAKRLAQELGKPVIASPQGVFFEEGSNDAEPYEYLPDGMSRDVTKPGEWIWFK